MEHVLVRETHEAVQDGERKEAMTFLAFALGAIGAHPYLVEPETIELADVAAARALGFPKVAIGLHGLPCMLSHLLVAKGRKNFKGSPQVKWLSNYSLYLPLRSADFQSLLSILRNFRTVERCAHFLRGRMPY
jgi:hypothetical protein